nr:MAG TPA: hypothetical protein [Caudoviricetes sp.]
MTPSASEWNNATLHKCKFKRGIVSLFDGLRFSVLIY